MPLCATARLMMESAGRFSSSFYFYCLLLNWMLALGASVASTSSIPVRLEMKRMTSRSNGNVEGSFVPKTQPRLFSEVLGLRNGEPFDFNVAKWQALVNCNLFRNLTARTGAAMDGVYLNVSGIELPSVVFSPEATLVASLENPEVLGGVSWRDINFRGLGEYLSVSIMKKEGLEEGIEDLNPSIHINWQDRTIGKQSKVAVNFDADHEFRTKRDLMSNALRKFDKSGVGGMEEGVPSSWVRRVPVQSTTAKLKLQSTSSLSKLIQKLPSLGEGRLVFGIEPFWRKFEMYQIEEEEGRYFSIKDELFSNGAKSAASLETQNGIVASAWYEGGFLSTLRSSFAKSIVNTHDPFHQCGVQVTSPMVICPILPIASARKNSNSALPIEEGTGNENSPDSRHRLYALFKSKFHAMRAWGSGCIPMLHQYSLSNPTYIRGFSGEEDTSFNHVSQWVSLKNDVYLAGLVPRSLIGLFLDCGLYQNGYEQQHKEINDKIVATAGMSLRAFGFRADFGCPVQMDRPLKLHLGFDLESLS